ncbi:MAG: hypothetical protein AUG51_26525 [Acidobacteria bacterium 13_1_20CM_3_53_8]|nr:MAG: hypothetical protein AUG51_26525 [Acidobacteria bacterium 13_1_20CM_3_53_8]
MKSSIKALLIKLHQIQESSSLPFIPTIDSLKALIALAESNESNEREPLPLVSHHLAAQAFSLSIFIT